MTKEVKLNGKRVRRVFTAQEKCQAILSIWSEKRKPSEVCREMGIQWAVLNQWQSQAMNGMMDALEPKRKASNDTGPTLGPRLEKLLQKTMQKRTGGNRLQKRMKRIQSETPST